MKGTILSVSIAIMFIAQALIIGSNSSADDPQSPIEFSPPIEEPTTEVKDDQTIAVDILKPGALGAKKPIKLTPAGVVDVEAGINGPDGG